MRDSATSTKLAVKQLEWVSIYFSLPQKIVKQKKFTMAEMAVKKSPKTKTDKTRKGKHKKVNARFNHAQMLEHLILDPVSGPLGLFVAIREAINNAIDAGATQVTIFYGTREGLPSITISDNGIGFNQKGVDSVMSYAYSSRSRTDVKTIGTNGTGTKCLLALGDYKETQVIFETVSKELEHPLRLENSYKYLLELAKGKVAADDYIKEIAQPKQWGKYLEGRTTGTDATIINVDKRKIREGNLANNLSEVLTPRAAQYVTIQTNAGPVPVLPRLLDGKHYEFSYEQPLLGKVQFDLYYGKRGDGPSICGPVNEIMHFSDIAKHLTPIQKNKIGHI